MTMYQHGRPRSGARVADVAIVAVLALLAAACGSTATVGADRDSAGVAAGKTVGADGLGPAPNHDLGPLSDPIGPGRDDGGTRAADRDVPDIRPGDPQQRAGSSLDRTPTMARASGPGFTPTEIKIGVPMSREEGAGHAAIGLAEAGDPRRQMHIVIDEVNRTGGIAGREVVPVVFEIDETSAQTFEQQFQAACVHWTEDDPVFAVANAPAYTFLRDSFRACLDGRGVPLWAGTTGSGVDAEVFAQFSLYQESASIHLGRMSRLLADDLVGQRFFAASEPLTEARLGLVRFDGASYQRAARQDLQPALAQHGIEITEEIEVAEPQRLSDIATVSAQLGNAVLRFNTRGVTHVLFLDESPTLALFFMLQAEQQEYRPRYGLHSGNMPRLLAEEVAASQLADAAGIGHAPGRDVPADRLPPPPGRERCLELMAHGGVVFANWGDEEGALVLCDTFFLLQRAAQGAGEPLWPQGLMSGLSAIDGSFPAASAPQVTFSTRKRDGAAAYRRLAFREDCACFSYTSNLLPAPPH